MSPAPARPPPRWTRFAPLALIAVLAVALAASGVLRRLSLTTLEADHAALTLAVARHPIMSLGAFFGAYSLLVAGCAPGLFAMTLAAGFLFGAYLGGAVTLAALEAGAVAVFLACRTAFGDWIARGAGPTLARLEAGFSRDAFSYLLALRLMPVAPFFLVTLAAGLARTRLLSFTVATLLGAAPSSFIIAGLGAGLARIFARHERLDLRLMTKPEIAAPLTALALLSLAPPVVRFWRGRRRPV
jgi:uncharacterized membrane protein YdjX (TVP38/TMEM64 family)